MLGRLAAVEVWEAEIDMHDTPGQMPIVEDQFGEGGIIEPEVDRDVPSRWLETYRSANGSAEDAPVRHDEVGPGRFGYDCCQGGRGAEMKFGLAFAVNVDGLVGVRAVASGSECATRLQRLALGPAGVVFNPQGLLRQGAPIAVWPRSRLSSGPVRADW